MRRCVVSIVMAFFLSAVLCACGDVPVAETVTVSQEEEQSDVQVSEPEATPEVTPEVVAEATPEVTPEISPEASPEISPEADEDVLAGVTKIEPSKKMYVQKACNIRKGPSTDFDIIGHASFNQEIEVIGRDKGGWYEFMQGDEVAFISDSLVAEEAIDMEALAAAALAASQQSATAPTAKAPAPAVATAPVAQAPAPVQVAAPAGVLFIGDSRCVQMKDAVAGGGCSWICQNGARYEWFADTAIPRADGMVGKGTKVVICMGVNDTGDVSKYAALTNVKAAEWTARGAKVYYVSVNPVSENPYTSIEQVENFNASIVGQLVGVRWIDTNTYLKGVGYNLVDGLHYDNDTYLKIFSGIISGLR